jgi:glucokinase
VIAIGLDVGGTKILGVAVDRDGSVLAEERRPTVDEGAGLLDHLASLYRELVSAAEPLASTRVASSPLPPPVGIGAPGLVDRAGNLLFSPNLRGASGTDLRAGLADRLLPAMPVIQIDNDATCAAAGESAFGAGAGRNDVLFVTLGTGIGGGIVSGGRLIRGARNFAGEIGHVVIDPQGPPCGCGRRGCWERYASGSGLGRIARDFALAGRAKRIIALAGGDADDVRGEHVMTAINEGDEQAAVILEEFAWWLAVGLANLANILDPQVIVIGGGLVRAGEELLGPVRRAFFEQVEGAETRPAIEIVAASLGDRGGAVGAAVTAFEGAGTSVLG